MKKNFTFFCLIYGVCGLFLSVYAQYTQNPAKVQPKSPAPSGIQFTQNKNQWESSIKFRAEIPNGFLFLKSNALQYSFYDYDLIEANHAASHGHAKSLAENSDLIPAHSFEVKFLHAQNPNARKLEGKQPFSHKKNYFLSANPSSWAGEVPSFAEVFYEQLYEGIDMRMYQKNNTLKYEFVVAPFVNPSKIALSYEHADSLYLLNGDLHIKTSLNEVIEKKPYCYQMIDSRTVEVPARFVLKENVLHFEFPEGYSENHELIIDPELVFSTYSGSFADNWGSTATFDATGHVYSGGIVFGSGFPTTTGVFQVSLAGSIDIGILKYDPASTSGDASLLYATYLGGSQSEFPHSLVVNNQDELVIFGTTSSINFPVTPQTFDDSFNGGNVSSLIQAGGSNVNLVIPGITYNNGSDIFLTKLNSTGSTLLGSTYFGGTNNDGLNLSRTQAIINYGDQFRGEVITDDQNNIYVTTNTLSTDFPVKNAFRGAYSGAQDGVIFKFNASLTNLLWSSFLGGTGFDAAYSVKINVDGNIYISGGTRSSNLRAGLPAGALHPTALGNDDGFIAAVDSMGNLIQITYLGTTAADQTFFVDFDEEGNLYALGQTYGTYPISPGVFHVNNSGQFIHKITSDLSQSLLSTTIGSGSRAPNISPTAFLVSDCGNIYLAGWGGSSGIGFNGFATIASTANSLSTSPLTSLTTTDAFSRNTDGSDFFIIILEKDMKSLLYGTFLGAFGSADHVDGGTSRFSKEGVIYQSVCASCGGNNADFPTTTNAHSSRDNSTNCNNAVFKIDLGNLIADFDILDAAISTPITQACEFPIQVNFEYKGLGVTDWEWFIDGVPAGNTQDITWDFTQEGNYTIELIARNPISCLVSDTIRKIFPISMIEVGDISRDTTICFDQSIQLNASVNATNAFSFQWSPTAGLSDPTIPNPIADPDFTTSYVLTVMDDNGCMDQDTVKVEVIQPLDDDFDILNFTQVAIDRDCAPASVTLVYDVAGAGTPTWTWDVPGFGTFVDQDSVSLVFAEVGTYQINLSAIRGDECPQQVSISKTLTVVDVALELSPDTVICKGESLQLFAHATDDVIYEWTPNQNISQTNVANPTVNPSEDITYKVKVTNAVGCVEEAQVHVEVIPKVEADFDFELRSGCNQPTVISLKDGSVGAVEYTWFIGEETVLDEPNPAPYSFKKGGTVDITLKVNNGKCEDYKTVTLEIEDNQSPLPNIITPEDNNINNTFNIDPLTPPVDRKNYQLEIYNRWGNTIYKSENYENEWGVGIEPGVYFYLLTSPSGVKCRGWVEVVK
ncbi:MAG: gliding motility-associated C-terminal domain-containing protein [Microscillaceae bacterium]|nr:gliding motility-associated C-terminal domain-containing protein [Microscillaceae bacterium]